MASLYDIDQRILSCVDQETGEVIAPEHLEALQMEREQKIEGVVLWIKNLLADAAAYKAEKNAFEMRQKEAEAKAESLKQWLAKALAGEKFHTAKCAVSFRTSQKVEVLDLNNVPEELLRKTTSVEPDKKTIKAWLMAGVAVPGCRLETCLNTQIK